MEEIYEYLGYILIAILLYLIVKHIYELTSKSKEGFMGIFKGDGKKGKGKLKGKSGSLNKDYIAILGRKGGKADGGKSDVGKGQKGSSVTINV